MQVDELIIDYMNFKLEKVKAIKVQKYDLAAQWRDEERQMSKKIFEIISPNSEFISWNDCDRTIDDYCKQVYNSSINDYSKCISSIKRCRNLKNLLD